MFFKINIKKQLPKLFFFFGTRGPAQVVNQTALKAGASPRGASSTRKGRAPLPQKQIPLPRPKKKNMFFFFVFKNKKLFLKTVIKQAQNP